MDDRRRRDAPRIADRPGFPVTVDQQIDEGGADGGMKQLRPRGDLDQHGGVRRAMRCQLHAAGLPDPHRRPISYELLPGTWAGADVAGQPQLQGRLHRRDDAQGFEARAGCGARDPRHHAARRWRGCGLRAIRRRRRREPGFFRDHPFLARVNGTISSPLAHQNLNPGDRTPRSNGCPMKGA
jgi:hypothetical protein